MKRREKIYAYIRQQSEGYTRAQLQGQVGMDAQEIAQALDVLRNNVSKDLNELQREGAIVKFSGRPVRYFDKKQLGAMLGRALPQGPCQYESIEACIKAVVGERQHNPFDRLVGAHRSLQKQVEQAKAAILYPPDGLHTLIVGQTGVGKTLFAHLMYEYGKVMHRFADDAPFVTFNCADYYNNPQLLIAHVFGHIKGAFTGADQARAGLVEEADGGVLFLDEIHRLPPEGQEMIFYFMDTGTFNRLGETTRTRHAKVLIIGATTEDPDSALTRTFVRRIPNIIKIKPLSERTLSEKLDIIRLLFKEEAQRVQKPIRVGSESVKALIGSIGNGNVGQLKSNIKLLCAQAFLNSIDNPHYIEVDFRMLPAQIRDGLLTLSANRQALTELTQYLSDALIVSPQGERPQAEEEKEDQESLNLYQVVSDKVALLQSEGIESDLIKQVVAADVNVYVKDLYNKKHSVNMTTRERLLKIVDPALVDFAEQVSLFVQKKLNSGYRDYFLYAFSLHLSAFLKRVKAHEAIPPYTGSEGTAAQTAKYLQVADEVAQLIERHYGIQVPHAEIEYIALLLETAEDDELNEKVIIVVATHGRNTASSMVEVAQKLFNASDSNLLALDMPLEVKPQAILDKLVAMLQTMNCRPGVLMLADMGSLCNFGAIIAEKLHIQVRTLDMVSTPLILEAMRKADIAGMDLDSIYESLRGFKGYEAVDAAPAQQQAQPEAIVTICTTGKGAALKLKSMVDEILTHTQHAVEVVPVGIAHLEERLEELAGHYHLLAAIGMKRPQRSMPFISLEQLLDGTGEQRLLAILDATSAPVPAQPLTEQDEDKRDIVVKKLCEDSLNQFLTYLNPVKVLPSLLTFDQQLEQSLGLNLSNPLRVRLIVHCGCALERIVTRSSLVYQGDREKLDERKVQALHHAAKVFEQALKLHFDEDELFYMANMI